MDERLESGSKKQTGEETRSSDISVALLKAMGKQVAGVDISDQEAAVLAPVLNGLKQMIRGIEVDEEVEPAVVFRCRKEG